MNMNTKSTKSMTEIKSKLDHATKVVYWFWGFIIVSGVSTKMFFDLIVNGH